MMRTRAATAWRITWFSAAALAVLLVVAVGVGPIPSNAGSTGPETIFEAAAPANPSDPDTAKVELGVQFKVAAAGQVTGVRFYKGTRNTGTHTGSLWRSDGTRLATGTFTGETASGWQTLTFTSPVTVTAGTTYVASYLAPAGHYAVNDTYLWPKVTGHLTGLKGVYRYTGGFPTSVYMTSNYWVDVSFTPSVVQTTTTSPTQSTTTPSSTPASTTSTTPATTPVSTTATTGTTTPRGITLRNVDGGAGYYGQWTGNTLPTDPGFFPIGVWMEQGVNAPKLATYGINMIVNPVNGGGSTININALEDEADMWGGPGSAAWTGNYPGQGTICSPSTAQCGFTIMQSYQARVPAGAMRYTNYGKGVAFWDSNTAAAQFVNQYQDVVSDDLYWGTDPDLCQASQGGKILGTGTTVPAAQCHAPWNYGKTVDRLRSLVSPHGSKPVWNYIEDGHPGTSGGTMPVAEIKSAVWSSLIHEARGIVYFNHSFGGTCQSQHVLDDCDPAIRAAVTAINAQIRSLAPVLNSPTIDGLVTVSGHADVLAKKSGADVYLFAGSTQAASQTVTMSLSCGTGPFDVVGESRTVNGTDTFADGNAVHIYRIAGAAAGCGI